MDLLKLITAVKTMNDDFYHGDVHTDIVDALTELVALREKIDEIKDILNLGKEGQI